MYICALRAALKKSVVRYWLYVWFRFYVFEQLRDVYHVMGNLWHKT